MHKGADCVRTDQSAADAAALMAELGVGALPICGQDERLKGVLTDRDLVVKVVAAGRDAGTFPAGDLNQDEAVTVGADDPVAEVHATMTNHGIRRVPVVDGPRLVGMITLADLARAMPESQVGDLVQSLAAA